MSQRRVQSHSEYKQTKQFQVRSATILQIFSYFRYVFGQLKMEAPCQDCSARGQQHQIPGKIQRYLHQIPGNILRYHHGIPGKILRYCHQIPGKILRYHHQILGKIIRFHHPGNLKERKIDYTGSNRNPLGSS